MEDNSIFKGKYFPPRWDHQGIYLAPCHRQYVKETTQLVKAPSDACTGTRHQKRFKESDDCTACELDSFLEGSVLQMAPSLVPKEAAIHIAIDDEPVDDIMEYCAECRNVDTIKGGGVVCLGSEKYRKYKGCLDIQIKWRNPDKKKTNK